MEKLNEMKKLREIGIFGIIFFTFIGMFCAANIGSIAYHFITKTIVNNNSSNAEDVFEAQYITYFVGKKTLVNFNGKMRNLLCIYEMNDVVKMTDGLCVGIMDKLPDEVIDRNITLINHFYEYLNDNNISFEVVITPIAVNKYRNQFPYSVKTYINNNLDRQVEKLKDNDIPYLDMREEIHEDGINYSEFFFKSDHHWNAQAGFYCYKKIATNVQSEFGIYLNNEISDIDKYVALKNENWYVGSWGRRTGKIFSGVDDFELLMPKYDTQVKDLATGEIGSYGELVINVDCFSDEKTKGAEDAYIYENAFPNLGDYINNYADNDMRLLVIGDSQARTVMPYLIQAFGETRFIHNEDGDKITREAIQEYHPDLVLMIFHPHNISREVSLKEFE